MALQVPLGLAPFHREGLAFKFKWFQPSRPRNPLSFVVFCFSLTFSTLPRERVYVQKFHLISPSLPHRDSFIQS